MASGKKTFNQLSHHHLREFPQSPDRIFFIPLPLIAVLRQSVPDCLCRHRIGQYGCVTLFLFSVHKSNKPIACPQKMVQTAPFFLVEPGQQHCPVMKHLAQGPAALSVVGEQIQQQPFVKLKICIHDNIFYSQLLFSSPVYRVITTCQTARRYCSSVSQAGVPDRRSFCCRTLQRRRRKRGRTLRPGSVRRICSSTACQISSVGARFGASIILWSSLINL